MKLKSVRVKNFRTIEKEETISVDGGLTIVGPNNTGKTNALKAVELLFTGYNNELGYRREKDKTFWVGRKQTSLVATFDGDEDLDHHIYEYLDQLHEIMGVSRGEETEFDLNLYFTRSNNPKYRILFPNSSKPDDSAERARYSRIQKDLVNAILDKFTVYYVPSERSIRQVYDNLVMPAIKDVVVEELKPHVGDIQNKLENISKTITGQLHQSGLEGLTTTFNLPVGSIEKFISGFEIRMEDPQETSIYRKGMGIQSVSMIASLLWITKKERESGKSVIWLLEEPESYLHPDLTDSCKEILDRLQGMSDVIITTHSINFVPKKPNRVVGTELKGEKNKRTKIVNFDEWREATRVLRENLGVKFGDFYNIKDVSLFVEGPSDKKLIRWYLEESDREYEYVDRAEIYEFGGVSQLEGFLRASWQFIRDEQAVVVILDGDEAGNRTRTNLQSYFGQMEIGFTHNYDFVSIRNGFSIEGLFPDRWIIEIHNEHPNWFDEFSVDAQDNLEPFSIYDQNKGSFQRRLINIAEERESSEWDTMWNNAIQTIDNALARKITNLDREITIQ